MPTPGSHKYDVRRTRLRGRLESEGIPDERADEAANRIMRGENDAQSPAARDDRAAGPLGERKGSTGDPGNVINLRSPAFNDHTILPARHSKEGENRSPALEWDPVPEGTVELALLCEDIDAGGEPFLHWLLTGMSPTVTTIDEGAPPPATEWPNDFGDTGYGGPRPPVGDDPHRYVFRLYALDSPLGLAPGADRNEVRAALDDKQVATGTLTGLFAR